jgi:hypothetical protein
MYPQVHMNLYTSTICTNKLNQYHYDSRRIVTTTHQWNVPLPLPGTYGPRLKEVHQAMMLLFNLNTYMYDALVFQPSNAPYRE